MNADKVSSPAVTAVVVTYQSAHTLEALFRSARKCHDEGLLECVVVDNGSTDATVAMLQAESSWLRSIPTGHNNGFGRGCNIGFEHVTTPYTLFLNPDAAIEPDALRTLLAFMEAHPQVGIAGPATVCGAEGVQPVFQITGDLPTPGSVLLDTLPLRGPRSSGSRPIVPGSDPFPTGWVCGAVFLVRTDLMRRLAGFDPRFFLYWEETDVCRRVADEGFEVWAVGTAVARHIMAASSSEDDKRIDGCIAKHYFQSRRYYLVKHHGWLAATAAELGEFLLLWARAAGDALRGRGFGRIQPRRQASLLSQPELSPQGQGKIARSC